MSVDVNGFLPWFRLMHFLWDRLVFILSILLLNQTFTLVQLVHNNGFDEKNCKQMGIMSDKRWKIMEMDLIRKPGHSPIAHQHYLISISLKIEQIKPEKKWQQKKLEPVKMKMELMEAPYNTAFIRLYIHGSHFFPLSFYNSNMKHIASAPISILSGFFSQFIYLLRSRFLHISPGDAHMSSFSEIEI